MGSGGSLTVRNDTDHVVCVGFSLGVEVAFDVLQPGQLLKKTCPRLWYTVQVFPFHGTTDINGFFEQKFISAGQYIGSKLGRGSTSSPVKGSPDAPLDAVAPKDESIEGPNPHQPPLAGTALPAPPEREPNEVAVPAEAPEEVQPQSRMGGAVAPEGPLEESKEDAFLHIGKNLQERRGGSGVENAPGGEEESM